MRFMIRCTLIRVMLEQILKRVYVDFSLKCGVVVIRPRILLLKSPKRRFFLFNSDEIYTFADA